MANHNPFNWVEIPVTDMARAAAFYRTVFEMSVEVQDMGERQMGFFPMNMDQFGAGGALVKEERFVPSHAGALVYFAVPDIDAVLARVSANGGKVLAPKTSLGEYGFAGYFEDSEGNRVGLHSMG